LACIQKKTTMRQIFLIISAVLIFTNVSGQKTELRVSLNSGLFSFSGVSAKATTSINYDDQTKSGYTNNPYGSKAALCYGVSLNLKRVTKMNIIFGLDLGYETLRSKISIDRIDGYNGTPYQYSASGKTFLNNSFLNFNPFIGYRFIVNNICFDLTGGFDYGYILKANEDGSATATNGIKYTTSLDRKDITFDLRPRVQLSTEYKVIGLYIGYSYGLMDYMMHYKGGTNDASARLFRFGITYKIK